MVSITALALASALSISSLNRAAEARCEAPVGVAVFETATSETPEASDDFSIDGHSELMAVVATNGERGYVYRDDFRCVESAVQDLGAEDPSIWYAQRTEELAAAFCDVSAERYGRELFDKGSVSESFDLLTRSDSGLDAAVELLNDCIANAHNDLHVDVEFLSATDFRELYDAAKARVRPILLVYEEDGVTQVGEFIVG